MSLPEEKHALCCTRFLTDKGLTVPHLQLRSCSPIHPHSPSYPHSLAFLLYSLCLRVQLQSRKKGLRCTWVGHTAGSPPPPPPNFRTHATLHTRMQASAHRGMQKYPVRCCSIVFMQNVKVVMQHPSSSILSIPNSAKFANSQAMQSRSSHRFHPNIQIHMQCSCPIHCTASSGQLMSPSWQ